MSLLKDSFSHDEVQRNKQERKMVSLKWYIQCRPQSLGARQNGNTFYGRLIMISLSNFITRRVKRHLSQLVLLNALDIRTSQENLRVTRCALKRIQEIPRMQIFKLLMTNFIFYSFLSSMKLFLSDQDSGDVHHYYCLNSQ